MASDTFPELSTDEHIRYGLALCLWALASDVAAVLLLGTGWRHEIAWGAALIAGIVASRAALLRWARRKGRPLVTREQWFQTWRAASRSWALSSAFGFAWGFTVSGATLRLPGSDAPDWAGRAVSGAIHAAMLVLVVMLWRKPKDGQG